MLAPREDYLSRVYCRKARSIMRDNPDSEYASIDRLVSPYLSPEILESYSAVMLAAYHPDAIRAIGALQREGFDVNANNCTIDTALNLAVTSDQALFLYLLSQGADPNCYYLKVSPLSNAADNRDAPPSMLSELLARGAKVEGDAALHWAAAACSPQKVRILLEHGADPSALNHGPEEAPKGALGTALHEAAGAHYVRPTSGFLGVPAWDPDEQVQVIELLLQAGADPRVRDSKGNTIEDWVLVGRGYKNRIRKVFANPQKEHTFDEERHIQRLQALVGHPGDDEVDHASQKA